MQEDENEIKERFYTDLEFGTAGLRGIIGAGTNRMNIYTVRRATQGLANYITKETEMPTRVLQLHMIPAGCHRNLQRKQLFVLQQTELKRMSLNLFARHRSCLSQYVNWDVLPVSILLQAITHRNTTDTKYTGRTVHRLHRLMTRESWTK